ncbi:PTS sugar transporter subunit IIA [Faecalicoccus pleomorphus]|uniref:PTS sugar transporter subunit IIA n=1 Tax=Faecalicoccus pleomorphus TaxID=1323 RepID=UPI00242ADBB8|nr:PTS sugar transporter subunit IIA [Faecalicoccus pleomorphus]
MEIKILVCTHGHFGEELIKSVEMIGGQLKNTVAIPLLENMSMDDYYNAVKKELDENKVNFCLTDLFGGTPCNTLLNLSRDYNIEILCGVNLPVLLETSNCNFSSIEETKKHLMEIYQTNGFDVLEKMRRLNNVD